jgi:hypothetical protein
MAIRPTAVEGEPQDGLPERIGAALGALIYASVVFLLLYALIQSYF